MAGVESGVLKQAFNAGATVRAMPNLPAQIGKGVTVLCSEDADMDRRQIAEELMRVLGAVEWIADEALFHAVTALSGRSEERRVGAECVSTGRYLWVLVH